jgi:hypothetical protein
MRKKRRMRPSPQLLLLNARTVLGLRFRAILR